MNEITSPNRAERHKMSKYVECQRYNVTPRQFYTYCKNRAAVKGINLEDWMSYKDWTDSNVNNPYSTNYHEDWNQPKREECKAVPYNWHFYLQGEYTFTFEFTHDGDVPTGCGYMYISEK